MQSNNSYLCLFFPCWYILFGINPSHFSCDTGTLLPQFIPKSHSGKKIAFFVRIILHDSRFLINFVLRKVVVFLFVALISLTYGQKIERKGLSVLEFREYGEASQNSGITVAELVTNGIDPQQYFIVERSQISQVLKEKLFGSGDSISEDDLKSLKLLGVSFVMLGSISKIEDKYHGGYRIVDVDSGQIGIKGSVTGAKDFQEFVDKVYTLLIREGFIKVPDKVVLEKGLFEQYKKDTEKELAYVKKQMEESLSEQISKMELQIKDLAVSQPSPFNLFTNSTFMEADVNGFPKGWDLFKTDGNAQNIEQTKISVTLLHPYTKGFVGPYTPSKPKTLAENPELATESTPYWYGVYHCGPRISYWGWCGRQFKIMHLKISGPSAWALICQHNQSLLIGNMHGRYHIRCYVKIIKGNLSFLQPQGRSSPHTVDKQKCDASPQGWYLVDACFAGTPSSCAFMSFGRFPDVNKRAFQEDLECYVALPYLYAEGVVWRDAEK